MSKLRKLFIGLDGTWNNADNQDNGKDAPTNVVKFLKALKSLNGAQESYYDEGVGTRMHEGISGGVWGEGLDKRVLDGYRFLSKRFNDTAYTREENQVYIFGFSRGAYTARRLSALIDFCGIPVNPNHAEKALEIYKRQDKKAALSLKEQSTFFDIKVEVVGVWDTVKSTPDPDLHDTQLPANVIKAYHAMSIDEKREPFPILKLNPEPRVLQIWFAGVHSDVGGGYANSALSDVPLRWMINRFLEHDVQFKANYVNAEIKPDPFGKIHNSFTEKWKVLGESPRKIDAADFIHESVEQRLTSHELNYAPSNLPPTVQVWNESL